MVEQTRDYFKEKEYVRVVNVKKGKMQSVYNKGGGMRSC